MQCYLCEQPETPLRAINVVERAGILPNSPDLRRLEIAVCIGCYAMLDDLGTIGPVKGIYLTWAGPGEDTGAGNN
jgi:hypothetical protein